MADIVLKDRNGDPVQYPGVERIKVNTVDGETAEFVDSTTIPEVVENMPIELDFSGGNQAIVAPDGVVVKSATIQKPATLIPDNIVEGVNIAGIVGALAGGGGAKIATGTVDSDGYGITVTHNLGVVPDIVILYKPTFSTMLYTFAIGLSKALAAQFGYAGFGAYSFVNTNNHSNVITTITSEDYSVDGGSGCIHNATETTFKLGTSSSVTIAEGTAWLAIGGLT